MTVMPVSPGDEVWVLNPYVSRVRLMKIETVESNGVRLKGDRVIPTPFNCLFDSEAAAVDAMIDRAGDLVKRRKKELASAERALVKLERQYRQPPCRNVPVLGRVDAGPTLPQSEAGRVR